ncbi:MAG: hypothetical protein CL460_03170 [Acidimicrobiaceae bacterium]|nr:hypothetical protein [Acidimicrobiaceae bacterium]
MDSLDDLPHQQHPWMPPEQWQFDFWSPDCDLGGWVHFAYDSESRSGWYVAALLGAQRPLVLVVDPHIRIELLSPYLEFRAEGIWAQHVCETPLRHWTVGLEAFGVTLDEIEDAMGDQWGTRIGVGLDLEWEYAAEPQENDEGFSQKCFVTGEVLIDDMSFEINSKGNRTRSWIASSQTVDDLDGIGIRIGNRVLKIDPSFTGERWRGLVLG